MPHSPGAKKRKSQRKLLTSIECAARGLIGYTQSLLTKNGFPEAIAPGGSCPFAKANMEWLMEALGVLPNHHEDDEYQEEITQNNRQRACRIMSMIVALGLEQNAEPIKNWKTAYAEWQRKHQKAE